MKKLLFLLLIIPCISFAERVVVIHEYKYIVEKTIINYETKPIQVKEWEYQGVVFSNAGDTIILKSDTWVLEIIKIGNKKSIEEIPIVIEK